MNNLHTKFLLSAFAAIFASVFVLHSFAGESRTWTLGKYETTAEFAGLSPDGKYAVLKTSHGQKRVAREKLSAKDKAWINSHEKTYGGYSVSRFKGVRRALLVGVDDYANLRDLKYAVADVDAVREKLLALGFKPKNVVELKTGASEEFLPTKANIEEQLDLLFEESGPDDLIFIQFSGHGFELDGGAGFAPQDVRLSNDACVLPETCVSIANVMEQLKESPVKFKWLVVDACRENPMNDRSTSACAQGLKPLNAPTGMIVLQSCGEGEFSQEDDSLGLGVFTAKFAEALDGKADVDGDCMITVLEILKYVTEKTRKEAPSGFPQTPHYALNCTDFVFAEDVTPTLKPLELKPDLGPSSEFQNRYGMQFKRIPAGSFMMGDALTLEDAAFKLDNGVEDGYDSHPRHKVTLTRPYYMGVYEVTVGDFRTFVDATGYKTTAEKEGYACGFDKETDDLKEIKGLNWKNPGFSQTSRDPVVCVSYDDATAYIDWLNKTKDEDVPSGYEYSLPTEAEWEYACRGGTTTSFFWGNEASDGKGYVNGAGQDKDSSGELRTYSFPFKDGYACTCPVDAAEFKANSYGLYHMLGNVFEWCRDWCGYYPSDSISDPTGPSVGYSRVIRGGGWINDLKECRSTGRFYENPSSRDDCLGFRVLLRSTQTSNAAEKEKTDGSSTSDPEYSAVEVADSGESKEAGDTLTLEINGVKTNFHWCPAGTFTMGSPESEEGRESRGPDADDQTQSGIDETQHEVTLTQGFWMGETEVTQKLWKAVMGDNPSTYKGDDLPVENVSWYDCQLFIAMLNGLKLDLPSGYQFSLPTEAQWEYACRAGSKGAYNGYYLDELGWYNGNSYDEMHSVGTKKANAWGLYDMHGNVNEWCQDWYDKYPSDSVSDSTRPSSASDRVLRGGGWYNSPWGCRSAIRNSERPSCRYGGQGFRLLLRSTQTSNAAEKVRMDVSITSDSEYFAAKVSDPDERIEAGDSLPLVINGVKTNFHWCPAGTFTQGVTESEKDSFGGEDPFGEDGDETQRKATLTQGFWMCETEVTQELWEAVMGDNPSYFKDNNLPVETVSWEDCQKFIAKLNAAVPSGYKFSLPTEAQWEYACRAGSTGAYNGSDLDDLDWYLGNSGGKTHAVGSKEANAWGLYDMRGNVSEWCQDGYDDYSSGDVTDPTGPNSASDRVVRGGSWTSVPEICRSAYRVGFEFTSRYTVVGFRLLLKSIQSSNETKMLKTDDSSVADSGVEPPDTDAAQKADDSLTMEINGVKTVFHWCPAGAFMMGSPESEEGRRPNETQHKVTLTQGFWMGETEVTQELWKAVMEDNPSHFKGDNLPVENVNWEDCQEFIDKLNGLNLDVLSGYKFSLPTEAQWEYACRAGSTGAYNGPNLDDLGWYIGNSDGKTHAVGTKEANAWGLCDMHGNVFEWCQDWKGDYPNGSVTDPMGPSSASYRVVRGGSWSHDPWFCRSADRSCGDPATRRDYLGFRVLLSRSSK